MSAPQFAGRANPVRSRRRVPASLAVLDDRTTLDGRLVSLAVHAGSSCVVGVTCQYSTGLTMDNRSCSGCPKMHARQPVNISSGVVGQWGCSVSGSPSRSGSFMDELLPVSRGFRHRGVRLAGSTILAFVGGFPGARSGMPVAVGGLATGVAAPFRGALGRREPFGAAPALDLLHWCSPGLHCSRCSGAAGALHPLHRGHAVVAASAFERFTAFKSLNAVRALTRNPSSTSAAWTALPRMPGFCS